MQSSPAEICAPLVRFRCEDAEDLTQNAIAEFLAKPVNELPVFVQLRQIVKSRFLDMRRAKESNNVSLNESIEGDDAIQPEEELAVRQVLERMPFDERALLWNIYGEGYSIDEIARQMRVNGRTVKRRLRRARMRFAAIYGDA